MRRTELTRSSWNRINWFRGRSAQIHSYTRPYTPISKAVRAPLRVGSRRENRPSSAESPTRRRAKRQLDIDGTGWADNAVDELKALEQDFGLDGSLSPAVEPDDGSNVVSDPTLAGEPGPTFDASSSTSSSSSGAEADSYLTESLQEQEEELLEGASDMSPTVLPAGPTRQNPMDAKPNAM